jgi:hypothetical protein
MVVFNKWWEFEPGFACVLNNEVRPAATKDWWPILHEHPRPRRNPKDTPDAVKPAFPRAVLGLNWGVAEFWCISDLLEHLPAGGKWQSSSECKAARMPEMFKGLVPSLVIAVGTAAAGDTMSLNGCVVAGTKCFMHNSRPNCTNRDSNWQTGPFNVLLGSEFSRGQFNVLFDWDDSIKSEIAKRLLPPPTNTASELRVYPEYDDVAVGNVNVSDYHDYEITDKETLAAFHLACPGDRLGSLETTHGMIRAIGTPRFMYISGIVDRLGCFHEDVDQKPYPQNFAGAHNAGVTLAWLLPRLECVL